MKFKILGNLDLLLASCAFVVLITVTFCGVIFRYIFNNPIIWAEEVQLMCFLWMTFLGAGAAFRYGSHVAVEIVFEKLPKSWQRKVEMFNCVMTVLILVYLVKLGGDLLALMMKIGKSTSILHIPLSIINSAVAVGCILMIISVLFSYYERLFKAKPQDSKEA